jgi:hypothetical protein
VECRHPRAADRLAVGKDWRPDHHRRFVLREFSYFSLKGAWHTYFLIFWAGVLPPALMFLVAWKMKRKRTNDESG